MMSDVPSPLKNDKDTTTSSQDQQDEDRLYGVEPFVVGLSPSYWAHIPMTIADVLHLVIVNGIPCCCTATTTTISQQWIPVSKCTLVGTLVYANANTNMYVLDDGSGLLDILAWRREPQEGMYALPKLHQEQYPNDNDNDNDTWRVGDTVRVMGRIECLSLGEPSYYYQHQPQPQHHQNDSSSVRISKKRKRSNRQLHQQQQQQQVVAIRKGIFEIHASIMEHLSPNNSTTTTTTPRKNNPNDNPINLEANHWMKSITRLLHSTTTASSATPATTTRSTFTPTPTTSSMNLRLPQQQHVQKQLLVNNATPVIEWLGSKIADDIVHQRHFPSADDTLAEWKVFGVHCTCHNLSYRDALLYCHCQATPELLDPHWRYRDALLQVLLTMEQQQQQQQQQLEQPTMELRFQYRTITQNNDRLHQIAINQIKNILAGTNNDNNNSTTTNVSTLVQQLQVATFRALRKDGILYLLHEKSDTHVLLSKRNVLEPYLRRAQQRNQKIVWNNQRKLPVYLQQVPMARLRYVHRCILQQQQQQQDDDDDDLHHQTTTGG
jgi:hypothetical protein